MLSPRLRWKLARAWERFTEQTDTFLRPQPKPRVCFSCGRLVGALEKVCSNCGASQSAFSVSVLKRIALAVIPAENPVTYALLFANLLFFAVAWILTQQSAETPGGSALNPAVLYFLGAKLGHPILAGELWRLVMPIFLHADATHIILNSLALWQVGPQVEDLFGSRRFLFLYLATGVAGNLASVWWYTVLRGYEVQSVGASGAIFGLIGILASYVSQRRGFVTEYRTSVIRWVIFSVLLGLIFPIDNAAHIGGLIAGMVLGRTVSVRRPNSPFARLRFELMTWGSAAVLLYAVAMVLLHLPPAAGS